MAAETDIELGERVLSTVKDNGATNTRKSRGATFRTLLQNFIDSKLNTSVFNSHANNTSNPHSVTKSQVGLGNVDNTSDANKPISTATQAALDLKLNASSYNDRFKGKYLTLVALQTDYPTASAGDYAQVDSGGGSNVINYNYDTQDGWVAGGSGAGATTTDELIEGSTNFYFTEARVRGTDYAWNTLTDGSTVTFSNTDAKSKNKLSTTSATRTLSISSMTDASEHLIRFTNSVSCAVTFSGSGLTFRSPGGILTLNAYTFASGTHDIFLEKDGSIVYVNITAENWS